MIVHVIIRVRLLIHRLMTPPPVISSTIWYFNWYLHSTTDYRQTNITHTQTQGKNRRLARRPPSRGGFGRRVMGITTSAASRTPSR